jgi:pilus assembly protein Flp/PilA
MLRGWTVKLNRFLKAILDDRSGATAVEYGLIAALIIIAMLAALNTFANETISMWGRVSAAMESASPTNP